MTGYPEDNRPAFREATAALRKMGFKVISPDELDDLAPAGSRDWSGYLRRDLPWIAQAEAAVFLRGWRESRGSTLEATIFNALGIPVWEVVRRTGSDGIASWDDLEPVTPEDLPHSVHPV